MTWFRPKFIAAGLIPLLAACAGPALAPVADTAAKPTDSGTAANNKPARMNGRSEITAMPLEKFFSLRQSGKVLLFDARPAFFYHIGHIPGAVSMPVHGCDAKIHARENEIKSALAKGKHIVVYCTSVTCPDARTLATHFSGFGYPSSVLTGGWDAWKDAGMPVE